VLAASALAVPPPAPPGPNVAVDGTAFRVTLPDGRVLAQEQLPGTVLTLGDGSGAQRRIRIDTVEHDPRDPLGTVVLYTLSEPDPVTLQWRNVCEPDPDGRRLGFPLGGGFTPDGHYVGSPQAPPGAPPGRILITCT